MISPDLNDGGVTTAPFSPAPDLALGTHCQLTKIANLSNPAWEGEPGLFEGYTLKGHYATPPTVGERFVVERYWRNGIEVNGRCRTSPVRIVEPTPNGFAFTTDNSAYVLIHL